MAKAKVETNNQYLDASPEDFSETVRALLADEREAYELLKACKAKVVAAVKAEMATPAGTEVKGTCFTRWGQWQVIVGDCVAPKAAGTRKTLADFLAAQSAGGRAT